MNYAPLVSIVIPNYNYAASVGLCVSPIEVTIPDNALVTLRVVNALLSSVEPPEPATLISFSYSLELE